LLGCVPQRDIAPDRQQNWPMENDQEREPDRETHHHATPKPVARHLCLIVFSHGATLLPVCGRAKRKWHCAAVAGVGDPGWVGWWRHHRGGEINGVISRLFRR
jgi:hypothetical protein